MKRVEIDDADFGEDQRWRSGGDLFTGEIVETTDDGTLIELVTVVGGIPDGPQRTWSVDGRLREEALMQQGLPTGTARTWHPNGQLAEQTAFDDVGDPVSVTRWDERGRPLDANH